ncbi:MAG TPA: SRPBCC family protein [Actinomycetota bacterium]|nr:SRPBCC family protein [Actinomycetota bacterium]
MAATEIQTTQVYQVYIKATPERIWQAITDPETIAKYFFGARLDAPLTVVGSRVKSWSPDRSKLWTDNEVLEADPPRRLVHTWRSLFDEESAAEQESRVTWEIEPQEGGYSKLTLVHDRLEGAPKTAASVSGGWMLVISGLKTLLETGEPLATFES